MLHTTPDIVVVGFTQFLTKFISGLCRQSENLRLICSRAVTAGFTFFLLFPCVLLLHFHYQAAPGHLGVKHLSFPAQAEQGLCCCCRWRLHLQAGHVRQRGEAGDHDERVLRAWGGAGVLWGCHWGHLHLEGDPAAEDSEGPRWTCVCHACPGQGICHLPPPGFLLYRWILEVFAVEQSQQE